MEFSGILWVKGVDPRDHPFRLGQVLRLSDSGGALGDVEIDTIEATTSTAVLSSIKLNLRAVKPEPVTE